MKYSTIEGRILQSYAKISRKTAIHLIDTLMRYIFDQKMQSVLNPEHDFFEYYLQLQKLKEELGS